ncbi:AraC family transcriptional regulator [Kangiella sp. HZ709]|uniref:AraC family transcriptional regulator n=1 Tax=Kangiella sp. HZ709 TaxID=2666328 RepID=UPI0012AF1F26|nr:AraC family transcriptional regulator [Kangiella sp. HZ709]MRX28579.1 helix-turn-helix domain-containing protein [Kangiella sp. HZ709]
MHNNENSNQLISALGNPQVAELLFDQLPDIVFFVKSAQGHYQLVNQSLVERCGLSDKDELIGKLPTEVFGKKLGRRYEQQDLQVVKTKEPLIRYLELHNYRSQETGWCLTTKIPILSTRGCAGVVGISQDLKSPEKIDTNLYNITEAIEFAENNLSENPTIVEMAKLAKMSPYQLDRRMRMVYGLTTGKWLLKTKISQASKILTDTNDSILDIALAVGYNDQSAFTRQFKKATGLTPTEFQKHNQTSDKVSRRIL